MTCFKGFILKLSLFLNIAKICFMTNIIIYVINSRFCSMLGDIAAGLGIQKSEFVQKMADPLVDEDSRVEWKYTCTRMYYIFDWKLRASNSAVFILFLLHRQVSYQLKLIIYVFVMKVLNSCAVPTSKTYSRYFHFFLFFSNVLKYV